MDKRCLQCGRLIFIRCYWEVNGKIFCGKSCWKAYSEKK